MAAHTRNVAQRNSDYHAIVGGLGFSGPQEAARYPDSIEDSIKHRLRHPPSHILSHDHVIFMGDLNYRIDGIDEVDLHEHIDNGKYDKLMHFDQLYRERRAGKVFVGMHEAPVNFPPTYKFSCDSDKYSGGDKGRMPAWTDRIMFRGNGLNSVKYSACMKVQGSDHKPVYALMELNSKLRASADASTVLVRALQDEQLQLQKRLLRLRLHSCDSTLDNSSLNADKTQLAESAMDSRVTEPLVDLGFVSSCPQVTMILSSSV